MDLWNVDTEKRFFTERGIEGFCLSGKAVL
jgi:hypothetical protein